MILQNKISLIYTEVPTLIIFMEESVFFMTNFVKQRLNSLQAGTNLF